MSKEEKQIPSYAKPEFKVHSNLLEAIIELETEHKKLVNKDVYNVDGGVLQFKVEITEETRPIIEKLIDIDLYNVAFEDYSHKPEDGTVCLSMLVNDHMEYFGAYYEIVWYQNQYDEDADDDQWTYRGIKTEWDDLDEQQGDDEDWGESEYDEDEEYDPFEFEDTDEI